MITHRPCSTDVLRVVINNCFYEAGVEKVSWEKDTISITMSCMFDLFAKGVHGLEIRLKNTSAVLAGLKSRSVDEKPSLTLAGAIEPSLEGAMSSIGGWLSPIGRPFEKDIHEYLKIYTLKTSENPPQNWVALDGHYSTPYKYFDIIVGFEDIEVSDAKTGELLQIPAPPPTALFSESPPMPSAQAPHSQTQDSNWLCDLLRTANSDLGTKLKEHKGIPSRLLEPILNYFEGAANLDWERHAKSQLGESAPLESVCKVAKMFSILHSNKSKTIPVPVNIDTWWVEHNKAFVKCNQITPTGLKTWRIDLRNKEHGWAIHTILMSKL